MNELEQYIHSYFGVTRDELVQISSFFRETTLKKGDFFLKEGRVCDKLSFHKSGLIRTYCHVQEKEVTQWISSKGYFVTDLAGILFDKPSRWTIYALSDSELYTIDKSDYLRLGKIIPQWHELEKLFIARCFTLLEDRVTMLLAMTAEERYHTLFRQQPELFNTVPLQYLASMMGMTPETLSRLRKKNLHSTS